MTRQFDSMTQASSLAGSPTANRLSEAQDLQRDRKPALHQQPLFGKNRREKGCNGIGRAKAHKPSHNADTPHTHKTGTPLSSELFCVAGKVSLEQMQQRLQRDEPSIAASLLERWFQTLRAEFQFRIRRVILKAPLPLLRHLSRICPTLLSPFSLAVHEISRGVPKAYPTADKPGKE
ncbi:hypothetical protein SAMN02745127_02100 [Oceanospirillum multiglobuliferum]|nr:hypothetical protein SAMN02745127_02100 [Oceanospirillum multiglobuliferum]